MLGKKGSLNQKFLNFFKYKIYSKIFSQTNLENSKFYQYFIYTQSSFDLNNFFIGSTLHR